MLSDIRQRLYRQLDPEAWPTSGLSPLNMFILGVITFTILFGLLCTEPTLVDRYRTQMMVFDRLVLSFFLAELLARLWTIGLNPRFSGFVGTLKYLFRPATLIDVIVIMPLFFSGFGGWFFLGRFLRAFRLIRMAHFPAVHSAVEDYRWAIRKKGFEMAFTACLGAGLLMLSSTTLYILERNVQPEIFGSVPRAVWWSVVTFTTVGYGDAVPITALGRFFTGIFAIAGIGIVAMFTGIIASALSEAANHRRERSNDDQASDAQASVER